MQFLQFHYRTQPFAKTYALVLLLSICTNVQFCKASWWHPPSYSSKLSTPEECARECQDGEPPKTCYYRFIVEYYPTNNEACNFCQPPVNGLGVVSKCPCIIGDGFEKTALPINRTIPGPSIQVCRGDKIIIDVVNEAEGIVVSIHWHGVFQKGSQYYDGVPYVTQCPIIATNTFRYEFGADNSGTHYYHSHVLVHQMDGQYGSLIIRDPPSSNPHYKLYDYDLTTHICFISDWMHQESTEYYPGRYRKHPGQTAQNFLINGRGDWTDPVTGKSNNITLSRFIVKSGKRYRFRVINACGTVCPITLSIQNHPMQIIATDGENINPISANAINMASGERYDFVLFANQTQGQYWIYVRGLGECEDESVYQLAVLVYQGSSESSLSPKPRYSDLPQDIDRTFNPLNSTNCEDNLCVDKMQKIYLKGEEKISLNSKPDVLLRLPFSFFNHSSSLKDLNLLFNNRGAEKFFVVNDRSHLTGMMDNITYKDSSVPLIMQKDNYEFMCGNHNMPTKCTAPCTCTHVYNFPHNVIVDIVIYDEEPLTYMNHPFHLHGYNFCVLCIGQFDNATNKTHISKRDVGKVIGDHFNNIRKGSYKHCAPKDTVVVPNTGFVIFRFQTNNPGWWFFHCHFSWHTASGMNVVFHVGDQKDLPPVPRHFPTCYPSK